VLFGSHKYLFEETFVVYISFRLFFYSWTTIKSYNLKTSRIRWSFMELAQIDMDNLCDLAGLPESLRLHRASSRTKLNKRKKTNFRLQLVSFTNNQDVMSNEKGYPPGWLLNHIRVQVRGKKLSYVSVQGSSYPDSIFDFYTQTILWILRVSA